jgi:hypothetical protein
MRCSRRPDRGGHARGRRSNDATQRQEQAVPKTVVKQANQLDRNDVIIAADSSRHVVADVTVHGLAAAWLTIKTDTGLSIDKTQDAAKLDTYDVLVED